MIKRYITQNGTVASRMVPQDDTRLQTAALALFAAFTFLLVALSLGLR